MARSGSTLFGKGRIALVGLGGLVFHVARRIALMPRVRRAVRVVLLGGGATLAVLFIVSALMTRSATAKLEAALAALRAAHEPVAFRELDRPPLRDEENAALLYKQAFALRWKPDDATREAIDVLFAEKTMKDDGQKPDRALLEKFLAKNAECIAKVSAGAKLARGRYPIEYRGFETELPHLLETRELGELLRVRAEVLAEDGRADEALAALGESARVATVLGDEPFLISLLVQIACGSYVAKGTERVLSCSEPSEAACRSLVGTLEACAPPREALLRTLQGERCAGIDAFGELLERPTSDQARFFCMPSYMRFLPGWVLADDELHYLALMSEEIDRVRREGPFVDRNGFDEEVAALPRTAFLTRGLVPAFGKVAQRLRADHAQRAIARLALALRIHRLRNGSYPEKLDALAPSILDAVPVEAGSGSPFPYERDGAGFRLSCEFAKKDEFAVTHGFTLHVSR